MSFLSLEEELWLQEELNKEPLTKFLENDAPVESFIGKKLHGAEVFNYEEQKQGDPFSFEEESPIATKDDGGSHQNSGKASEKS